MYLHFTVFNVYIRVSRITILRSIIINPISIYCVFVELKILRTVGTQRLIFAHSVSNLMLNGYSLSHVIRWPYANAFVVKTYPSIDPIVAPPPPI